MRRDIVKRRVGTALYQVMEHGDQIMAGALAITGPSAAWDMLLKLPALAGGVAGAATWALHSCSALSSSSCRSSSCGHCSSGASRCSSR